MLVFYKGRPKELIGKILKIDGEIYKYTVVTFEISLYLIIFVLFYMFAANITLSIPTQKIVANNKIVIYNSSSELLVANYKEENKSKYVTNISIDFSTPDSVTLIQKGNDDIKIGKIDNVIFNKGI